ncbi:MAG: hypothetical protein HUU16_13205 [Candidatus Omnitrophica bacterium]|nr:hypothetical protein [Candidatus Omnitrophota bacterium]
MHGHHWVHVGLVGLLLAYPIPARGEESAPPSAHLESATPSEGILLEPGTPIPLGALLARLEDETGLDLHLTSGVAGMVHSPTRAEISWEEFLGTILPDNGFLPYREPNGSRLVLSRDLGTHVFNLSSAQFRALTQGAASVVGGEEAPDFSKALALVIHRESSAKSVVIEAGDPHYSLSLSPRRLTARDTRKRLAAVEDYLKRLAENPASPELALISDTIRPPTSRAEDVAWAIDEALYGGTGFEVTSEDDSPSLVFNPDTGALGLRHTARAVEAARRLASEPRFNPPPGPLNLRARKFVVVSNEDRFSSSPDAKLRKSTQVAHTRRVFEGVLYSGGGIEEAAAAGRVLFANPERGTIDVVDTPENLRRLEEYLVSVPTEDNSIRGSGGLIRVVPIRHRPPEDIARVLGGYFPGRITW